MFALFVQECYHPWFARAKCSSDLVQALRMYMPNLFLVFHLSCASGYLPSLSFLQSYISPHFLCSLWGLIPHHFSPFPVSWFVLLYAPRILLDRFSHVLI